MSRTFVNIIKLKSELSHMCFGRVENVQTGAPGGGKGGEKCRKTRSGGRVHGFHPPGGWPHMRVHAVANTDRILWRDSPERCTPSFRHQCAVFVAYLLNQLSTSEN